MRSLFKDIDFSEELGEDLDRSVLNNLCEAVTRLRSETMQGVALREGTRVVIAGPPNVGKSSLFNEIGRAHV